jgi:thioredoxin-dependent peroxiredoxin
MVCPSLLLSDDGGEVRGLYWVPTKFRIFPGRVTYFIDEEWVITHTFSSQLGVARHVEEALRALESLSLLETRLPNNWILKGCQN